MSLLDEDFIHPTDKALTEKILQVKLLADWLENANNLDEVCAYFYSASLPQIVDETLIEMMNRACLSFEIPSTTLYRTRTFEYDVVCVGCNKPVVVLPAVLLNKNDHGIIQGRLYSAAAAIAAQHPKFEFLLWAFENIQGLPFINSAVKALLYEWNRAKVYTLDRAFFLATGNLELTLKNIFYGIVPFEWLENFHFKSDDDIFLEQAERYFRNENPAQILGKFYSFFMDYAWLPTRYDEIKKFSEQRRAMQ